MSALAHLEDLRRKFRALVPSKKISRKQWREIVRAAALEQVREVATIERAIGVGHDKGLLDEMRTSVRAHLKSAGARFD